MQTLTKKEIKQIAKKYNVDHAALKVVLKAKYSELKRVNKINLIETMLINYGKQLDDTLLIKLADEYTTSKNISYIEQAANMNEIIESVAKDYSINPRALERHIRADFKEDGILIEDITRLEVLEVLYINAPSLFYTREDEIADTVEYLEIALSKKLILEMNSLRDYAKSVEVR